MSYNRPDGNPAGALNMPAPAGGGSVTLAPPDSTALSLTFKLPATYGDAGDAMVDDGAGTLSWVPVLTPLVLGNADDILIGTLASANGNVTIGRSTGSQIKTFSDGTYYVKNDAAYIFDYDPGANTFSHGDTQYTYAAYTTYASVQSTLTPANNRAPRVEFGSGSEVVRVGGNLRSLVTASILTLTAASETVMLSEVINASFLDEAGTQVRVRFSALDVAVLNTCQFKFRIKYGTTTFDSPTFTVSAGGFTIGEFVMQIVTDGANPTRNIYFTWQGDRNTGGVAHSTLRSFAASKDFTIQQTLQLVAVGVANSGDTFQVEQATMNVTFPETQSS